MKWQAAARAKRWMNEVKVTDMLGEEVLVVKSV